MYISIGTQVQKSIPYAAVEFIIVLNKANKLADVSK